MAFSLLTQGTLCALLFGLCFDTSCGIVDNVVTPSCSPKDASCQFTWTVKKSLTMTYCRGEGIDHMCKLVKYDSSGQAYSIGKREEKDGPSPPGLGISECLSATKIPKEDAARIVAADGSDRSVLTINGQLPGPAIVVYEGQEIVVNLTNAMYDEGMTMHWHGVHQVGTPWMDGAGDVSQCPINPGDTFTYRFRASPVGTQWYHLHLGVQRAMGAFGPLIILPRPTKPSLKTQLKKKMVEFHLMVQDWFEQSVFVVQKDWEWRLSLFPEGYSDTKGCFAGTFTPDGADNTLVNYRSILINGKGQHYPANGKVAENPGIPLEVYYVKQGDRFRFRATSAVLAESFRVSVDGHPLHVDATEDQEVVPIVVESFIFSAGERFSFWIDATNSDKLQNYWIRVEGINIYSTAYLDGRITRVRKPATHTGGILTYTNESATPVSKRKVCTKASPCKILNCPYQKYPEDEHIECIPLTNLTPINRRHEINNPSKDELLREKIGSKNYPTIEKFLNFQYIRRDTPDHKVIPAINGITNMLPTFPPQVTPGGLKGAKTCNECSSEAKSGCQCTHVLSLPLATTVYLVVLRNNHPFHMHGHTFELIKIGYPTYDPSTGYMIEQSKEIKCVDVHCYRVTWTNSTWHNENLPGAITPGIRKDTMMIPDGGYIVIRFFTHNPGFWFMHCHMQFHNAGGMSLIVQEGNLSDMPAPPPSMKQCGNFYWTEKEYMAAMKTAGFGWTP